MDDDNWGRTWTVSMGGPQAIGTKWNWGYPMFSCGLAAYAAKHLKRRDLALQAWRILLKDGLGQTPLAGMTKLLHSDDYLRPLSREVEDISTNSASQWSLNAILCLEFIPEELPATVEEAR
jgi:hypothetical protein